MDLIDYTKQFMFNILEYKESLKKMEGLNKGSDWVSKMLVKLKEEYICDEDFYKISVEQFLDNEWIRFQVVLSKRYSEYFYGPDYVMRFLEFISFRDAMEAVMVDQVSDQSVYTRIVNALNIPLDQIPNKYIQMLYSSDEFMFATNFMLNVIHSEMEDPAKYFTIDEYRSAISHRIDKAIVSLQEKGYFGTYEKEYMMELFIAYKVGFPMIGPLYMTSKFPRNPNKYEDLKIYVNHLWEQYKNSVNE